MNVMNGKKILLVEDDAIIALNEKSLLGGYGYDVITANTGEKAVAMGAGGVPIDLVLMDIDLGAGMDGTEAAGIILKSREIPVIFLSSHSEPEIVRKTENISSYGYVEKSSSITVLDASIKMAFKLFDANGQIKLDVGARTRAKENLVISEARYRRLFESAKDGILILDAESGRIVDVNPFLIDILGYSKEEFIKKSIWEIGFFKDIIANKENFNKLKEKKYVRYENLPLETAAGEIIDVEFISNVYLVNDREVIQCNIREIAARKRSSDTLNASEIRYRRLFETAKDGILILDGESGRIVDVNPFLIDMLGYSRDQFVEKSIWEIGFFKDAIANKEKFLELKRNKYVRYENLPLETASGKSITVEFVSNLYDVDGQKVIQCNIRDITERKLSEELLRKSDLEKQELLRELQHRVKNSFNMISIMINLAADKSDSPPDKNALAQLDARVRSVSELYSLLYSSDSFIEVRLDKYCASVANAIIGLSSAASLVTEMEEITISAKAAAPIGLILTELITNAVKYGFTAGRKGCVTVSLRGKDGGAILEVADDGGGLREDFDPAKSQGMGLKLVMGLTEQIEGKFKMEGEGKGTRCRLEFPL
jgi:PAS domain S-box-containing protein